MGDAFDEIAAANRELGESFTESTAYELCHQAAALTVIILGLRPRSVLRVLKDTDTVLDPYNAQAYDIYANEGLDAAIMYLERQVADLQAILQTWVHDMDDLDVIGQVVIQPCCGEPWYVIIRPNSVRYLEIDSMIAEGISPGDGVQ